MRRALLALLVSLPVLVVSVTAPEPGVVHALPPGFSDELVATFARPTGVERWSSSQLVVLEQHTGRVRVIDPRGVVPEFELLDLPVCTANEQGLLGFALDHERQPADLRMYVYYTRPTGSGCVNRVSAFTFNGLCCPTEHVLIDNISAINGNHNGGDLEIGNDGYLYIGVGDAGRDPRGDSGSAGANDAAQDGSLLNGKILRIDRFTGQPAAGNPFVGPGTVACGSRGNTPSTPTTTCREIFALGLRNPYRIAFDPNTSATRFFINDVGQNTQEEINEGIVGANYGWNSREGNCPRNLVPPCAGPPFGLTDPIEAYTHSTGTFITAGAFVPDGAWPAEYDGGYLFADGGVGKVWLRDAAGDVDYGNPFLSNRFGIAEMTFVMDPDGWALYYTQNGNGQLRRVTFDAPTTAPSGPLVFDRLASAQRAFDSRATAPPARLRAGHTRLIPLGPQAVGAKAALVNITLASSVETNFATVWEPRTKRPGTSNINARSAHDVANASVVPLDDQGRMLVYVDSTADVIVDVTGFFRDAPGAVAAGRFAAAGPSRLVDLRQPSGPGNMYTRAPSADGELVNIPVAGLAGVPATDVDSVVLLVSGISGNGLETGWLTAFAGGTAQPPSSNVNVNGSTDTRVNTVVVPLGADGSIDVFLFRTEHLIVEVVGWFSAGTAAPSTAGRFHLVAPTREAETRTGLPFPHQGGLDDGETLTINPISVPDGATGVVQNLTFAPSGGWGFVTASPDVPAPAVSNLNATAFGQTRAALAFTPLNATGSETFTSALPLTHQLPHQLLVDVFGYFE